MTKLRIRRTFLRDCLIAASGAGVGLLSPELLLRRYGNSAVADMLLITRFRATSSGTAALERVATIQVACTEMLPVDVGRNIHR